MMAENYLVMTGVLLLGSALALYSIRALARNTNLAVVLLGTCVGGSIASALIWSSFRVVFHESLSLYEHAYIPKIALLSGTGMLMFLCMRHLATTVEKTSGSIIYKQLFVPDIDALADGRLYDLVRQGLFQGQIAFPQCLRDELLRMQEHTDEAVRLYGKRAYDTLSRLEALRCDVPITFGTAESGHTSLHERLATLSRKVPLVLITTQDTSAKVAHIPVLALDTLAYVLRPSIPRGERLTIKVQRIGKEPKQGIGYLEDGSMVVVNGGGDFLGKTVVAHVLSQKYSSSGRIVFCNMHVTQETLLPEESHMLETAPL